LINKPTAIDRAITKAKLSGSKSLRESKVNIKNIGKDKNRESFRVENILKAK